MSDTPSIDELHEQQQLLKRRELGLQQRNAKMQRRDELEAAVIKDLDKRDRLRKLQKEDQTTILLEERIATLKKEKVALDHWLDDLEDVTEDSLKGDRQRLAALIIAIYPNEKANYATLQENLQKVTAACERIQTLLALGNDIVSYLQRAIAEGKSIRRGGFLRYIAGVNPNVVATACLTGIKALSQQTREILLAKTFSLPPNIISDKAREDIVAALTFLEHKSQEKWRWRTFAADFQLALDRWQIQMQHLKEAAINVNNLQSRAISNIDEWIYNK